MDQSLEGTSKGRKTQIQLDFWHLPSSGWVSYLNLHWIVKAGRRENSPLTFRTFVQYCCCWNGDGLRGDDRKSMNFFEYILKERKKNETIHHGGISLACLSTNALPSKSWIMDFQLSHEKLVSFWKSSLFTSYKGIDLLWWLLISKVC